MGDAKKPCSGSVELHLMQGRVGEVVLAKERRQASFVVAAVATFQSRCETCFQSETVSNPARGVRAWLFRQSSSLNAAGVGSCCLATNSTGVTAPATELNARR